MAGTSIEDFFVALGFEVDSSDLKSFKSDIDGAKDAMMSVVKTAAIAAGAIGLFVTSIASAVDELGDFAEVEQMGVDVISEFGHAAQLMGADLNAAKSSVSGVNKVIGEAVLGIGRGAKTFEKLGMQAKNADGSVKTFDDILTEVAGKMEGMSRQESIAMAEKLGIDRKLIPLLTSGADKIAELRAEARAFGAVTKKDAQISGAYMDSLDRTVFMVKGLARGIAVELMPAMTQMMDGMRKWFLANREIIMSKVNTFLQVVVALLGIFWDYAMRLIGALMALVEWLTTTNMGLALMAATLAVLVKIAAYKFFGALASGIRVAWAALTVFNVSALIATAIVGGLIIALVILIDEFINFKEGNESFIGDLVKEYPQLLDVINTIANGVAAIWGYLKGLWNEIAPAVGQLGDAFVSLATALGPVLSLLWEAFKLIVSFLVPIFLWLARIILEAFAGVIGDIVSLISGAIKGIAAGLEFIAGVFRVVFGGIRDFVAGVFDTLFSVVDRFIGGVQKAVSVVGNLLGMNSGTIASGLATSTSDAPGAFPGAFEPTGGIGVAAGPSNTTTSTTVNSPQISAPVTIYSNDPATAGKSVSDHLTKSYRDSIRNNQSAVAL